MIVSYYINYTNDITSMVVKIWFSQINYTNVCIGQLVKKLSFSKKQLKENLHFISRVSLK